VGDIQTAHPEGARFMLNAGTHYVLAALSKRWLLIAVSISPDQVARILAGKVTELRLSNLEARRDWRHAADYVEVMFLVLLQRKLDDYVVATGETHSIREFVELAFGMANLDYREYVKTDPLLHRQPPAEVEILTGDPSKAQARLGRRS
jgi:GDP-D-mannose dehydratase